jgi:hypothetical protein
MAGDAMSMADNVASMSMADDVASMSASMSMAGDAGELVEAIDAGRSMVVGEGADKSVDPDPVIPTVGAN